MAPSVPRTKTSNTPLDGEVAAGDDVRCPPIETQLDHDVPVHVFWYRAPFVPSTKTPRRLPDAAAAGPVPEAICPATEVQPLQELPPFVVVF